MSDYYSYPPNDYRNFLMHREKGSENKNHKYLEKIVDGARTRYIYTRDELKAYYNNLKKNAGSVARSVGAVVSYPVRRAGTLISRTGPVKAATERAKARKAARDQFKKDTGGRTIRARVTAAKNKLSGAINVHKTNKGYQLGGRIGNKVRAVANAIRHPIKSIKSKINLSKFTKKYYSDIYNSKMSEWQAKADRQKARGEKSRKRGSYSSKAQGTVVKNPVNIYSANTKNGGRTLSERIDKSLSAYGIRLGNQWAATKSQLERSMANSDYNKYLKNRK